MIKRLFYFCLLWHLEFTAFTQHKVIFEVRLPYENPNSSFFIASGQNQWKPDDTAFQLKKYGYKIFTLEKKLPTGKIELKITKGTWQEVETDTTGKDIANRSFSIQSDTIIHINVAAFNGDINQAYTYPKNTASPQVKIIAVDFFMPMLNAKRKIWIYLPKTYDGKKRFPVLYMQDGQNLFDDATAFNKEWGIDEYLDSAKKTCIVVGIENGGTTRMDEYNFFKNKYSTNPKGNAYAHFIVNTLRPYINRHYKTKKNKANTYIAGSSMGGLISYLTALEYPKIFGKAGIFSPSFWINYTEITEMTRTARKYKKQHFYFYAGLSESKNLESEVKNMYKLLDKIRPDGKHVTSFYSHGTHDEKSWRKQLPAFFQWLLN